ncbi:EthD family reductase [Aeromicrobium sp.]|uniref:EthD family reductase n=1 Tax=Aeromicrobium sp. TaxID=1871063 RepID=UPI0028A61713|nr:EthD family reductase [Aeromicrobium sp.]
MKLFILIRRDPAETHDEFMDWWAGDHAELASRMPGLGYYALHEIVGSMGRVPEWDGIAELTFESSDAARAAFDSPEGRATLDHATAGDRKGARRMMETTLMRVVRDA